MAVIALVMSKLLLVVTISAFQGASPQASVLQVNNLLNIYQTCLTEIIFIRHISDIEAPSYPVTVYSSFLVNKSKPAYPVLEEENRCRPVNTDGWGLDKIIPKYDCKGHNYFTTDILKNFRFNCISLILVGVESQHDLRETFKSYRNTWVHVSNYGPRINDRITQGIEDFGVGDVEDEAIMHYYNNLYLNVAGLKDSGFMFNSSVWSVGKMKLLHNYAPIPNIYIWTLPDHEGHANNTLTVSIIFNSPCVYQINGLALSNNINLNSLNRLLSSELKLNCENLVWTAYTEDVDQYYGPPIDPTSRQYLETTMWKTLSFELIILSGLLEVLQNTSIYLFNSVSYNEEYSKQIATNKIVFIVHTRLDYKYPILQSSSYFNPTETNGFRFMTCHLKEKSLSFQAYITPYQIEAWLTITATFCFSTIFLTILFQFKNIQENGFLLIYSFLLEHGYHLSKRLTQLKAFNVFLGTFLLMGIVLTNGYKGIVITDLTSPIQESRLRSFKEAMEQNHSILTSPKEVNLMIIRQHFEEVKEECLNRSKDNCTFEYRYKNNFMSWHDYLHQALSHLTFGSEFLNYVSSYLEFSSPKDYSNPYFKLIASIYNQALAYSEERAITVIEYGSDAEFLKCNKSIFVDNVDSLKLQYLRMKSRLDPSLYAIYMVEDEIGESLVGWHLGSIYWSKGLLPTRMNSIFSSGIYQRWNELKRLKLADSYESADRRRDFSKSPRKLGLSSNVVSLFVIYLCMMLLIPVVFFCENRNVIIKYLQIVYIIGTRMVQELNALLFTAFYWVISVHTYYAECTKSHNR